MRTRLAETRLQHKGFIRWPVSGNPQSASGGLKSRFVKSRTPHWPQPTSASIFIFAQPEKKRLPQFCLARLLSKLYLRRKQQTEVVRSLPPNSQRSNVRELLRSAHRLRRQRGTHFGFDLCDIDRV